MVAIGVIQEMAESIVRQFGPDRIVLFGSHARGTAGPDSDVDILVVMAFDGKPFWKSLEIVNRVNPSFPVDLLARRPEDVGRRYALGDPLIRDAMDHGQVLYERSSA